ncbi:MAG: ornithine carbamoyltransferase [Planctomycetota bacterium]
MSKTDSTTSLGSHLLSLLDWSGEQVHGVLDRAAAIKANPASHAGTLGGVHAVMLFEKPSLRTRVSFEIGLSRLGAHALFYDTGGTRLGARESVHDYACNLERFCDLVVARVFSHEALTEFAGAMDRSLCINALSDRFHPCQGLADVLTISEWAARERRDLSSLKVAFVGEGNNVCHSLMLACARVGVQRFTWLGPEGYEPAPDIVEASRSGGLEVTLSQDLTAVSGSHVVYTDTWISMGDESEAERRRSTFAAYTIDDRVMAAGADGCIFMHCLPAHRGEEVTDAVIDSDASVVFDQAENRMWAQMGLCVEMLRGGATGNRQ